MNKKESENKITERELLDNFKKIIINKDGIKEQNIILSSGNKSKEMDFNIIIDSNMTCISLEAKVFNDNRSNSNMFLSIFGKILKGRELNKYSEKIKNINNFEYGFLFCKKDSEIVRNYFSIINKEDWIFFCRRYDVKHIYFCNEDDYTLYKAIDYVQENDYNKYISDKKIFDCDVDKCTKD